MRRVGFFRVLALLAAIPVSGVGAQGSCTYNGTNGNCTVGNTATYSINLTITTAVRLALSTAGVALDPPGAAEFDAGFGTTVGPTLTVKANRSWTLTIRSTQALWTASPPPARANKPSTELRVGLSAGGPFTNLTTTAFTLQTGGAATAGTVLPLYFRVVYSWLLDTPGTYSLPLQLTLTAP